MYHGFGTTLSWNGQVVAKLTNIGGLDLKVDDLETTTHQATSANKTFIPGLVDPGEIPIEGNFDPSDTNGQVAMVADAAARTTRAVVVTFPAATGTTLTIPSAYINALKIGELTKDGLIPFSAKLRISGVPTFAVATSAGLTTTFLAVSNSGVIVPTPAQATLEYTINFLTAVSSITLTPTAAAGVITITANGVSQVVTSGQASTAIALGAAGSITNATISIQETNKAPKVYTIHLVRA